MKSKSDIVAMRCIGYYALYPDSAREDILHTQEVVNYTRLIALQEEFSQERLELLECAAWLHDIGCPRSKRIYGNSLPENQQRVGRDVAQVLLQDMGEFSEQQREWIVEVVSTHHQALDAERLEFQPLFEADLIANLLSGYHSLDKAPMLYDKLMKTEGGRALFRTLIREKIEQQ